MNTQWFHFRTGDFECTAISDGSNDYALERFFANAPRPEVEAALRQHDLPTERITTPYTFLFVDTGHHRVLVDMGAGKLDATTGQLAANLESAGIAPASLDSVVVTHAHPDHVGGTRDDQGRLIYANATYYISKTEWDFWFSDQAVQGLPPFFATIARDNLGAIQERTVQLEGEVEFLPGVVSIPAPGHTPGHMVVSFRSGGALLTFVSDTVLHPLHLEHSDWLPVFDILPEQAAASKQHIFDWAAETGSLVLPQHFPPFPSLGHIVKEARGWRWQPLAGTW